MLSPGFGLSEPAAEWSVNSWALALGLVSADELKTIEQRDSAPAQAEVIMDASEPPPSGGAAAVVVSAEGSADYTSIVAALRDAATGARILVRPGVYDESITLDREVEIVGDGPREEIIVRGAGASCIHMRTDEARVAGLTLRGDAGGAEGSFAVDITQGRLVLEDCDVSSPTLSCVGVRGASSAPLIRR